MTYRKEHDTMTDQCRWGIMATGLIADLFAADLSLAGLPVAAVGSRSAGKADAFAAKHGIPTAHSSYEDLVADPDVDVIYVATPHPFHVEGAKLALNAGKHVLIEKPFAMNAREAREIVALAEAKNLLVMEAMWTRFLPHMVRLREILSEGTLGEIHSLWADHSQALPDDPNHRLNAMELGGGALLDLGIYPVSFAHDVLGPPAEVQAVARFKDTGADAEVAMVMRHASGALSQLVCTSDYQGSNAARIVGAQAILELDGVWYSPTTFRVRTHAGDEIETCDIPVEGRGMQYQAHAFQDAVQAGKRAVDLMTPEGTVEVMQTMDTIRDRIGLRYAADDDNAPA
ncbi:Gfo/Idh/MocA family protein [Psychromarinibacter halotolerans]|uniref:Gfo/Idh/MocA family protein n=1 Tax=Psychromarinibacter halotolerans TaxID=1775175 RepID=A0ABV7GX98_9RHOB|nr:Gfo/Idh/MocA family oxidoreductase [Psychromarinibacter halotolerans]MDF0598558.1 Gfo/Idh/MocA family oxidoreductase [Psychromarinibacter halotolerans]